MSDVRLVARRAGRIAIDRGFEPPSWANYPTKMMGVVTEIEEAIEALHNGAPADAAEEMADIVLRALDMLESIWGEEWSAARIDDRDTARTRILLAGEPRMLFAPHMSMIRKSIEAWRRTVDPASLYGSDARIALELTVVETFRLADRLGVDLLDALDRKCERNASRATLNGKAQASF